jgi:hypothetical protein
MPSREWNEQASRLRTTVASWEHGDMRWCSSALNYLTGLAESSANKLDLFANELNKLIAGHEDVAILACGSYGRLEAHEKSDVDVIMVTQHEPKTEEEIREKCMLLKTACDVIAKVAPQAFDTTKLDKMHHAFEDKYLEKHLYSDVFRRWVPLVCLTDGQFSENDSLTRQIRRISMLLESQPLTDNQFSASLRRTLLNKIYRIRDRVTRSEDWQLLSRDVLRFVHSSHLFHDHKIHIDGKGAEPRYQKLIITRKMLGVATYLQLRYIKHGSFNPDLLCEPPSLKLLKIINDDAIGCTRSAVWPPSLKLLGSYASAIESIHMLPESPVGGSGESQATVTRNEIGMYSEQMNSHIDSILTENIRQNGHSNSQLLQQLL